MSTLQYAYQVILITKLGDDATEEKLFLEEAYKISKNFDTMKEAEDAYDLLSTFDSFENMELSLYDENMLLEKGTTLVKRMMIKDANELEEK